MKTRPISGIAAAALALGLVAMATPASAGESRGGMGRGGHHGGGQVVHGGVRGGHVVRGHQGGHRWGKRIDGRWHAGHQAPGGWRGYRRPSRGYILPSYWINPGFYLNSYALYGLYQPQAGYGWSRYYDDAVLTDRSGRVYDSRSDIAWERYEGGYEDGYAAGRADAVRYDNRVLAGDDRVFDYNGDVVTQGGGYDGAWSGNYVTEDGGVYQGSWAGTYQDAQGQVYDGQFSGTFTGEGQYVGPDGQVYAYGTPHWQTAGAQPQYAPAPQYDPRPVYRGDDHGARAEMIERCRRDNGLGGAVIGGVVGGVAGNRIAGRGNRTEGTIIGGVVGAVTGAAIDRAEDDPCRAYRRAPQGGGYAQQGGYGYGYGYAPQGYYYAYPPQQPTVTTVVVQSQPVVTTTTTTIVEEEYVTRPAARRVYKPKPKAKPRPKPRCVCR